MNGVVDGPEHEAGCVEGLAGLVVVEGEAGTGFAGIGDGWVEAEGFFEDGGCVREAGEEVWVIGDEGGGL